MLVVYALWRIVNTHKCVYISYQMKAEIIFVSRGYKNMTFYQKITNKVFKTDAPYTTMYFRCVIGTGLIACFAGGPQEKVYRTFTVMMIIVAYDRGTITEVPPWNGQL